MLPTNRWGAFRVQTVRLKGHFVCIYLFGFPDSRYGFQNLSIRPF